jgi:hypothetical protein
MNEGELGKRIKQKIIDGEGLVSYSFGIVSIINEAAVCFSDKNELSSEEFEKAVHEWFRYWFVTPDDPIPNPLGWNKANHGKEEKK